ncbi:MAG: PAS domain-containing sensor histidine kinase [Ginsengibacter sp.]
MDFSASSNINDKGFELLANALPLIVWSARPDGFIDFFNQKWYDYTGFPKNLGGDQSWVPILHPDDIKFCIDTWYHSIKTGEPYKIEYRFVDPENIGKYRWFLGTALPVKNETGEIVRWFGTCTDINDQKNIETRFRDSEEKFHFMCDAMPQHVWTADAFGQFDYFNQRTLNYFDKPAVDILSNWWTECVHEDDSRKAHTIWKEALSTGEPFEVEFRLKDKDGHYKWHLSRATPFINKDAEIKWFGTNTDIEEHKLNEQKKDEFIGIASHELKTPVTSLKGYVHVLRSKIQDTPNNHAVEFLNRMDVQVNKLNKLIGDVLDVTRLDSRHLHLTKQDIDFRDVILEAVDNVQHIATHHKIVLETDGSIPFTGDKLRLEQVISNFLTNAIKYSPDKDKVIVKYRREKNNIITSIQDFGIGIERENLTRLFDRFYRVDNTSMKFQGLGLGLYIASEIIKAHNGSFWIESEPGKGSIFFFLLPVDEQNGGVNIETDNQTFYSEDQVSIKYNKVHDRLDVSWMGFQNLQSVKRGCNVMLDLLKKNNCSKVLNDNTFVTGNWSEASDWGGKIWFPAMQEAGLKYFAWIYSPSTFSQLAANKSIDVMLGKITTQFFAEKKDAEKWLNSLDKKAKVIR